MLALVSMLNGRCQVSLVATPLQLALSLEQTLKCTLNHSIHLQHIVKPTLMQFSLAMSVSAVLFPLSFKGTHMEFTFPHFFLLTSIVKLEGPERLGFVEGQKVVVMRRGLFAVLRMEIQVIQGGPVGYVSRGW